MNKIIVGIIVAVVVIGGGWYLLSNKSTSTDTGPIKIGVILPLTGEAAVYGQPFSRILQIAADDVNAKGGANGRSLQLIVEDGQCNGTDGANAAQKLVNVDKVQVIVGGFCSSESLSAEPIATAAKVTLFSPGSSSPKLTGISPFFARNYPSDSFQGKILADIAYTDKGWKKVAFIQEQTDYAQGVYTAFSETFTKLGGTVTNESFPTGTTDFRSIVSKVKGENPDAVFISVQTPAAASRALSQISQLGWKPKILVADIVLDVDTITANKDVLEGALAAEFSADLTSSKFTEMVAAYKAKYGEEPPYQGYASTVYDSLFMVADAIEAVGYDGTKIANWLHNDVKDWQGAAGKITIGSNGDPTVGHRPEVIMGGKVVPYVK